jgi:protein arginine kinase
MQESPIPKVFFNASPWQETKSPFWPASVFILRRNVSPYFFPDNLKERDALSVKKLLEKALTPFLDKPRFLSKDTITPLEKEFLFEHFLLNEGYERFDEGRALIVDDTGSILGLINVEDHLHVHLYTTNRDLKAVYAKLAAIEKELSKTIPFSFSERFGYLTSDPRYAGTGLTLQAFLHLPLLIQLKRFSELKDKLTPDVVVRGLGKENEYVADLALLENRATLGVSEENIIESVQKNAAFLEEEEKKIQKMLSEEEKTFLKDKIGRSFGLLSHARSLSIQEALTSFSFIEIGKRLNWVQGDFSFHEFFFSLRRAHLVSEPKTPIEINEERAKFSTALLSKLRLSYGE